MKRVLSFLAIAALCLTNLSIALAQGTFTLPQASASNGGIYALRDAVGEVAGGVSSGGVYSVRNVVDQLGFGITTGGAYQVVGGVAVTTEMAAEIAKKISG